MIYLVQKYFVLNLIQVRFSEIGVGLGAVGYKFSPYSAPSEGADSSSSTSSHSPPA